VSKKCPKAGRASTAAAAIKTTSLSLSLSPSFSPKPTAAILAAMETAEALDTAWFACHPKRRVYMRRSIDGEFSWPMGPLPTPSAGIEIAAVVYQWAPGVRFRVPLYVPENRAAFLSRRWTEKEMSAVFPKELLRR
jgi:hypothetical protein